MCGGGKGCSILWCFLYFLAGFALLGVGIWTPVDDRVFDSISAKRPGLGENPIVWRGWVGGLIALGSYSVLVGILGMAGAACDLDDKIKNSLIAFAVFASIGTIGTLVLSAVATAGYATTDRGSFDTDLLQALQQNYSSISVENDFYKAWNRYQINSECCGVNDHDDYRISDLANNTAANAMQVPWSCCKVNDKENLYPGRNDVKDPVNCELEADFVVANPPAPSTDGLNDKGCGDVMWDRYRQWQTVVMAISWTSTGIEIIALIVTGCLKKDAMRG